MNRVIAALVAQKASLQVEEAPDASKGQNVEAILPGRGSAIAPESLEMDMQKAWQRLADEPLYILEVEIYTGVKQTLGLADEDLGLDPGLVEGLIGGYRTEVSKRLNRARNKLIGAQKKFYNQLTVYAAPFRFVLEETLPAALEHIAAMSAQAETLRQELTEDYEEQVAACLTDLNTRLEQAIPYEGGSANAPDEPHRNRRIERSLMRYAGEFPDLADFKDSLQIVVKGPIKLNSLSAQLKADKALQTELAQQEKSAAQTELETKRLQTQQEAERLLQRNLLQAFQASKTASLEEGYGLIGQFLARTDTRTAGELTERDNDALALLFDRLNILAQHNDKLQPLVEEARKLRELYGQPDPDIGEVTTAVENFQAFLLAQASQDSANTQGLQKLTRSLAFSSDYKALTTELTQLATHPDATRLDELEGKIQSDLDVLQLRQRRLKKLFTQAQKAAQLQAKKPPDADSPYDSAAGF